MSYYGFKSEVLARLDKIIALQEASSKQGTFIMATLNEVVDKVAAETTLVNSLKVFVQGLKDQIAALPSLSAEQQAQIDGIFAHVSDNSSIIADAMSANTPPTA